MELPNRPVVIFDKTGHAGDTPIFSAIKPRGHRSWFRVTIALSAARVLKFSVSDTSTTKKVTALSGASVAAATFDFPAAKQDQTSPTPVELEYSIEFEGAAADVDYLVIDEIEGPV